MSEFLKIMGIVHTVGVTGSNPVSPIPSISTSTRAASGVHFFPRFAYNPGIMRFPRLNPAENGEDIGHEQI
jgi:hypothetical protein